jgi:hypothetical protein
VSFQGTKKKGDAIMDAGDDDWMAINLYAQYPVAAQPVAQNNIIPILLCGLVDLSLDNGLHLLRCSMERLFQKNEGDPVGLKAEKLISHDVASNDKISHKNLLK